MIKDADIAYVAGIVDGEGSFHIRHVTKDRGKDVNWFKYRLTIVMASKAILDKCQQVMNCGTINSIHRMTKNGKVVWRYQACASQVADACHLLMPFLIDKREQAQIIIELSSTMNSYGNSNPVPEETINYRIQLKTRLEALTF